MLKPVYSDVKIFHKRCDLEDSSGSDHRVVDLGLRYKHQLCSDAVEEWTPCLTIAMFTIARLADTFPEALSWTRLLKVRILYRQTRELLV